MAGSCGGVSSCGAELRASTALTPAEVPVVTAAVADLSVALGVRNAVRGTGGGGDRAEGGDTSGGATYSLVDGGRGDTVLLLRRPERGSTAALVSRGAVAVLAVVVAVVAVWAAATNLRISAESGMWRLCRCGCLRVGRVASWCAWLRSPERDTTTGATDFVAATAVGDAADWEPTARVPSRSPLALISLLPVRLGEPCRGTCACALLSLSASWCAATAGDSVDPSTSSSCSSTAPCCCSCCCSVPPARVGGCCGGGGNVGMERRSPLTVSLAVPSSTTALALLLPCWVPLAAVAGCDSAATPACSCPADCKREGLAMLS